MTDITIDDTIAGDTEDALDTTETSDVASQAVGIYAAVQNAAIGFEIATAGAKLARDKAKAVTG